MDFNRVESVKEYSYECKKGYGILLVQLLRGLAFDTIEGYKPVGVEFKTSSEEQIASSLYETKRDFCTELQKLTYEPLYEDKDNDLISVDYEFSDVVTPSMLSDGEHFKCIAPSDDMIIARKIEGLETFTIHFRKASGVKSEDDNRKFLESRLSKGSIFTPITSLHSPIIGLTHTITDSGVNKEIVTIKLKTNGSDCDKIMRKSMEMVKNFIEDFTSKI